MNRADRRKAIQEERFSLSGKLKKTKNVSLRRRIVQALGEYVDANEASWFLEGEEKKLMSARATMYRARAVAISWEEKP